MKTRIILFFIGIASSAFAADMAIKLKVEDKFKVLPSNSVHLNGVLGETLDASLNGTSSKDIDMLVYPFKVRNESTTWRSEFWGKWFTSMAWAYEYNPSDNLDKILKRATKELIKTQDSEGAIKTVMPEYEFRLMNDPNNIDNMTWDIWGRKYVLLGLLAEYNRTSDKTVLEAAKRHTDYIIDRIGEGKKDISNIGIWFGIPSSSILEPIALLYQYTGEQRYLEFANYIIANQYKSKYAHDVFRKMRDGWVITDVFPKAGDPKYWYYGDGGSKAYEIMSCFEGLLEMYRITGNKDYLKSVENLAKSVRDTEVIITGSSSVSEKWRKSKHAQHTESSHWQETCVTTTWLKFCTQLLRISGNPIYAGDIELVAYNAMIGAQNKEGSWWCHFSPLNGKRVSAPEQCKHGPTVYDFRSKPLPNEPNFVMNCCVASGPRGLFVLPKSAFMAYDGGVVVNLYENSSAKVSLEKGNVEMSITGFKWGESNTAKIKVIPSADMKFGLKLYIPEWSKNTKITVNGKKVSEGFEAGKYCEIVRLWKSGDIVELCLDAKVELLNIPSQKDIFYLKYGPFVLSMDKRFEPNFNKPADVADNNGVVEAKKINIDGVIVAFEVPMKDGSVRKFINYSDAGKTWDDRSEFVTIFMRNADIKYVPVGNRYKAN